MSFHDMRLSEPLVRAVVENGYSVPTPIQASAIPVVLSGKDVLGCAQTGTGKTCAFALPMLQLLSSEKKGGAKRTRGRGTPPRALVLCPTRELATQIHDSFVGYGRNVQLRYTVIYGGVSQGRQVRDLRGGVDVVVATPGRLLDLVNQGHADLSGIEVLVLDEADRMLDMGFIPDIRKVVRMVPTRRQTLFFSATMSKEIRTLADAILVDPVSIETERESSTVESIDQRVYMIDRKRKILLLEHLLRTEDMRRTLVFTRTKYGADKLAKALRRSGIGADAIHGNKSQNARFKALEGFKAGESTVLVATDIASRGIDVDEITHVVNYDMPIDPETYVHRIGRTARAGASGVAMSFCGKAELSKFKAIERGIKVKLRRIDDLPHLSPSTHEQAPAAGIRGGSTRPKPRRSKSEDGRSPSPGRSKGKRGKQDRKRKQQEDDHRPSREVAKSRRKKSASKGGWNIPGDDRASSGDRASGKRKKTGKKGRAASAAKDQAASADGRKRKGRKKAGKGKWKSAEAQGKGPAASAGGRKKAKMGKAKWKAKAASAGRKSKVAKARKKKTTPTPGHRGSPGYKKKSRAKGSRAG